MSSYDSTTSFLQSIAQQALTQAGNNASRIYSLPPHATLRNPNFSVTLDKPNLGQPPVFADMFTDGDTTSPTLLFMNEQADAWMLAAADAPAQLVELADAEVVGEQGHRGRRRLSAQQERRLDRRLRRRPAPGAVTSPNPSAPHLERQPSQ